MGLPEQPHKVKLIAGLLSSSDEAMGKAIKMLSRSFGKIDFESRSLAFTHSDYYRAEMGDHLMRRFVSFERLADLTNISRVKRATNAMEAKLLRSGRRTVNIDPGYLDLAKVVLFSTKDYTHRIYLDKGIFAEVTLFYKDKKFRPWPWTYPDYKTDEYADIFGSIRSLYKDAITC